METFGQRIKKAWKNINEIKPKKEEKKKKSKAVFFNGEYIGNCIVENCSILIMNTYPMYSLLKWSSFQF